MVRFDLDDVFRFVIRMSKIQEKEKLIQMFISKLNETWKGYDFSFEERLQSSVRKDFFKEESVAFIQVASEKRIYGQIVCRNILDSEIKEENLLLDLIDLFASFLEMREYDHHLAFDFHSDSGGTSQNKKIEQKLFEKENQIKDVIKIIDSYELLFENSDNLIFRVDKNFRLSYFNLAFDSFKEEETESFMGRVLRKIPVFSPFIKEWEEMVSYALNSGKFFKKEMSLFLKDQTLKFECVFIPERRVQENDSDQIASVLLCIRKPCLFCKKKLEANEEIERKNILLKELHHRIKNNLMSVCSFLNLQSENITDNELKFILKQAILRLESVALLHTHLCKVSKLDVIDLKPYLFELINNIKKVQDQVDVQVEINLESVDVSLDMATSVGLCVNEIITNSFKHVYSKGKGKILWVNLKTTKKGFSIQIKDDGPGFPLDYSQKEENKQKIGLLLLDGLSRQMNAELKFSSKKGAKISLKIPLNG